MIAAKQTNREIKRQRILDAALKLFARKGFEATALEEVARGARLAKGTLYLYFKDKEDLYAQVVYSPREFTIGDQIRALEIWRRLRCSLLLVRLQRFWRKLSGRNDGKVNLEGNQILDS